MEHAAYEIDVETLELLGLNPTSPSFRMAGRSTSRFRVLGSSPSPAADGPREERRRGDRVTPDRTRWSEAARLRPGFEARIVDLAARGALIEVPTRVHIGIRVELSLQENIASGSRLDLAGVVRRCFVASLSPLCYRAAIEFTQEIDLTALNPFSVSALSA